MISNKKSKIIWFIFYVTCVTFFLFQFLRMEESSKLSIVLLTTLIISIIKKRDYYNEQ